MKSAEGHPHPGQAEVLLVEWLLLLLLLVRQESAGTGWVVGVGGGVEEAWAGTYGEIGGRPR